MFVVRRFVYFNCTLACSAFVSYF